MLSAADARKQSVLPKDHYVNLVEADIKAQIARGRKWWLVSNIPALYQLEARPNAALPDWIFPTPEQQYVMDVLQRAGYGVKWQEVTSDNVPWVTDTPGHQNRFIYITW
ncbi:MAG: hypothetical protein EBT08_18555 [Betaproteobacteria bacterium]|nr:hypothetical protein [Betaproteobacteria bacterium]